MKLKASILWLCCAMLLFSLLAETEARICKRGEALRFKSCQRTCTNPKGCNEGKKKKICVCSGSTLRDEKTGKCVSPTKCPSS